MKIEELEKEEYEEERIDPIKITIETRKEAALFMLIFGFEVQVSRELGKYLKLDWKDIRKTMNKTGLYSVLRKTFPDMTERKQFKEKNYETKSNNC